MLKSFVKLLFLFSIICIISSCSNPSSGTGLPASDPPYTLKYRVHVKLVDAGSGSENGKYVYAYAYPANTLTPTSSNAIAKTIVGSIQGGTYTEQFKNINSVGSYDFIKGNYDIMLFIDEDGDASSTSYNPDTGDQVGKVTNRLIDSFDDITINYSSLTTK